MSNSNRVQKGVPTGGQFASTQRAEADVTLDTATSDAETLAPDEIPAEFADRWAENPEHLGEFRSEQGEHTLRVWERWHGEADESTFGYTVSRDGTVEYSGYDIADMASAIREAETHSDELAAKTPQRSEDEVRAAARAALADGKTGWAAANAASRALGYQDGDAPGYKRAMNLIADETGIETPYPRRAALDAEQAAPGDAQRDAASGHRKEAHDSFQRSDVDGFLSQHVSGLSANKADLQGHIDDDGGRARFVALADADGNLVAAKGMQTKFGFAYGKLSDPDDPHSTFDGFVNTSSSSNPDTQRAYLAKRGYREVFVMAPAYADFSGSGTGMSGMLSVHAIAKRRDGGFSRDVEILPDVV